MSDPNSNQEEVDYHSSGVSPPSTDVETASGFPQSLSVLQPEFSSDDDLDTQSDLSGHNEMAVPTEPGANNTKTPVQRTQTDSRPQWDIQKDEELNGQSKSSENTEMTDSTEPGSHNTKTLVQHTKTDSRPQWEIQKERFMKMPLDEKREQYACGRNYTAYNKYNFPKPNHGEQPDLNKVCVWRGDITTLEFDAIVNAANERMRGGGGVDGAIHTAAGPFLLRESIDLYKDGCEAGEAKITGGYKLPAKYIIHTVGPRDKSEAKLRSCYESVLRLVKDYDLRTVAFPCIATGIFGYPNDAAADVAFTTVLNWLSAHPQFAGRIVFCVFLSQDENIYNQLIQKRLPSQSSELLSEQPAASEGRTRNPTEVGRSQQSTKGKAPVAAARSSADTTISPKEAKETLVSQMATELKIVKGKIKDLEKLVQEKDAIITQQGTELKEVKEMIKDLVLLVQEKDVIITQQGTELKIVKGKIKDLEKLVQEKDAIITQQGTDVQNTNKRVHDLESAFKAMTEMQIRMQRETKTSQSEKDEFNEGCLSTSDTGDQEHEF
ncbi:ADP-ribose glycohydrolase MACROD2-like isoform X2 [Watersipora subatra]|uniref:ADP-ribose glycohydrolase MACROD2-like isoform X2 n=1 Tax=Watersipora subatra TaxID=2589382 RepID=UPI00355C9D45